jgi:membrane fusion protein, heavy metal efflux system
MSNNLPLRNPFSKQIVPGAAVLGVLAVVGLLVLRPHKEASQAAEAPKKSDVVSVSEGGAHLVGLETEAVSTYALPSDIQASGFMSYPANSVVHISPRLSGRLKQVNVNVGDHVTVGQVVAVLESVDAAGAVNTLKQAENRVRTAKQALDRQERLFRLGTSDVTNAAAALDQAKARTQFTSDALARIKEQAQIGGFTQKPLEDARTALAAARAAYAQAQSDLAQSVRDRDRKSRLVDIGVGSRSDLEASVNVYEKAAAGVTAAKETLQLAEQAVEREKKAYSTGLYANQAVRAAESDYQQAVLQQQAAERALSIAKAQIQRDLEQARSDYESASLDLANANRSISLYGSPGPDGTLEVRSPITGVVTERLANPGQAVDQSQMTPWQMLTIVNTDTVWVDADVYEKDLARVQPGQLADITVAALPGKVFPGKVLRIAPVVDAKSHSVHVRAEIPNLQGLLRDGMYCEVKIHAGAATPAVLVPLTAVQHDGDRTFIYVCSKDGYLRRTIHVLKELDGKGVVDSGLLPGERIVAHGAIFLNDANGGG